MKRLESSRRQIPSKDFATVRVTAVLLTATKENKSTEKLTANPELFIHEKDPSERKTFSNK